MASNRGTMESLYASGVMPLAFASFSTDWECSSLPTTSQVSCPVMRLYRISTSAPIFSKAWPRWGTPLT